MSWLLPESFSTFGPDVDFLYYVILWVTGVVFVITEALLVYFVIRYRRREGQKATYIHGSTKAEIIWTTLPFIAVLALAFISIPSWNMMKNPDSVPADALDYIVNAKQFEWEITYAGTDGVTGTADDISTINIMHVPVNQAVNITLRSEDVLHSFFLPEMRVKQDAVPGMDITVWFEATAAGAYPIGCAELCGNLHTTMGGTLNVYEAAEFDAWVASQSADADDADDADDQEDQ
ncbi:MAG: cytochrome c oxidase subunit II [Gammaproteobacteria bacterium]|nr:cytochrome c oxidase subunit II [Gammaproteobacteria bacterium]MXW08629.1 cytochrome c oxidase subunit II [Gammaproteobacteria bacterium]MYC53751.1 cytochrome c oxidase subunit II [Gammaproteobacteria bacterium]